MSTPELAQEPNPYDVVADLTFSLAALLLQYVPGEAPRDFHTQAMCVTMAIGCMSISLDQKDIPAAQRNMEWANQLLQELTDITPQPGGQS